MLRSRQKSDIVKINYFFKNLVHKARLKQTEGIVTDEGSTNMTRRAVVLVLGFGKISYIVKMHYFF